MTYRLHYQVDGSAPLCGIAVHDGEGHALALRGGADDNELARLPVPRHRRRFYFEPGDSGVMSLLVTMW